MAATPASGHARTLLPTRFPSVRSSDASLAARPGMNPVMRAIGVNRLCLQAEAMSTRHRGLSDENTQVLMAGSHSDPDGT